MPQGNHHLLPSGIWWQTPTSSSIPKLLLRTLGKFVLLGIAGVAVQQFRALSYKYTYTNFIGKSMSLGKLTTLTHEPLSVEEIDQMKASRSKN